MPHNWLHFFIRFRSGLWLLLFLLTVFSFFFSAWRRPIERNIINSLHYMVARRCSCAKTVEQNKKPEPDEVRLLSNRTQLHIYYERKIIIISNNVINDNNVIRMIGRRTIGQPERNTTNKSADRRLADYDQSSLYFCITITVLMLRYNFFFSINICRGRCCRNWNADVGNFLSLNSVWEFDGMNNSAICSREKFKIFVLIKTKRDTETVELEFQSIWGEMTAKMLDQAWALSKAATRIVVLISQRWVRVIYQTWLSARGPPKRIGFFLQMRRRVVCAIYARNFVI